MTDDEPMLDPVLAEILDRRPDLDWEAFFAEALEILEKMSLH